MEESSGSQHRVHEDPIGTAPPSCAQSWFRRLHAAPVPQKFQRRIELESLSSKCVVSYPSGAREAKTGQVNYLNNSRIGDARHSIVDGMYSNPRPSGSSRRTVV